MDKSKDLTFEQKEQPFFKGPEESEVNADQQQAKENLVNENSSAFLTKIAQSNDHCYSMKLSIDPDEIAETLDISEDCNTIANNIAAVISEAPAQLALDSPSHPRKAKPEQPIVPSGSKPNVDQIENIF